MNENDIIVSNTIKCKLCNDIIYSAHRHDFKKCKCGEIFVDGGTDYLRRGASDLDNIIEMSIIMDEKTVQNCIDAVHDSTIDGKNERGIAYTVLRALRDNGYNLNSKENA